MQLKERAIFSEHPVAAYNVLFLGIFFQKARKKSYKCMSDFYPLYESCEKKIKINKYLGLFYYTKEIMI